MYYILEILKYTSPIVIKSTVTYEKAKAIVDELTNVDKRTYIIVQQIN